jgi:hypothetical protein
MKTAFVISLWSNGNLAEYIFRIIIPLVIIPIFILVDRKRKNTTKPHQAFVSKIFIWMVLPFWMVLHAFFGFQYYLKTKELVDLYQKDKFQITEGLVHVIRQQPYQGHAPGDLIEVSGNKFVIDQFTQSPCYTKTIAYDGILREATRVRIYSIQGQIVRLDYEQKNGA